MSYYFEIAYAAESNRLCFFTGTGFSKAISDNTAPSWQGLLEECCDLLPDGDSLKESLFPKTTKSILTLEEAAQVIAIELQSIGKSIHIEIASIINRIKPSTQNDNIIAFLKDRSIRVVTTNYDLLFEALCSKNNVQSLAAGLPIPKSSASIKVYHVHGSVNAPEKMVVTSQDYFNFFQSETYFSRKLSTILHENTIVIIGYSLGDTNLKNIINDYKKSTTSDAIFSNIIYVSRSPVAQSVKNYYSHCFGIRVIDNTSTQDFFKKLNVELPNVKGKCDTSLTNLKNVLYRGHLFVKDYIKIENSFYEIIASISASGLSLVNEKVVSTLGQVIETKRDLTIEAGAWEQYEHLAKWLVHLGSILDLSTSLIKEKYLDIVLHSMKSMRKELYFGYSWQAYNAWHKGWLSLTANNRIMIRNFITDKTSWPDALHIVKTA